MTFADDNPILFASNFQGRASLRDFLEALRQDAKQRINSLPRDQFLNTSEETLVENAVGSREVQPLVVYKDAMEMEEFECQVDVSGSPDRYAPSRFHSGPLLVSGIRLLVLLPYSGDPELWDLTPSSFSSTFPHGNVHRVGEDGLGRIEIVLEGPSDDPQDNLTKLLNPQLEDIDRYVEWQAKDIGEFNAALPQFMRQVVQHRLDRLQQHDGIVKAIGIPLAKRDDAPTIRPLPLERRLVRPLPPPPGSAFQAQPGIRSEDYEHILAVIRHEGRTFEAAPATFALHDEEGLRDILLAHLNGHYKGDATGETFRKSGKTDIRIEDQDRAAFVAECGIWDGPAWLTSKLEQLLGYLTWRDCKAALVVFNKRNRRFSPVLEKTQQTLRDHPHCLREQRAEPGEWRIVFTAMEDEGREITVHVFVFDISEGQLNSQ